ncbi:hypothetical protein CDD81_2727 [Ophiocordyceps australis]|uniref:SUN domain-containing protein n=1 Tax=Ophiocordyceps australis TaxID=1399860 RepID=A0A2C5Y750_9HYPO|nr:hypothetical protein CDD81_2727 [Ophiocordyceps australis]
MKLSVAHIVAVIVSLPGCHGSLPHHQKHHGSLELVRHTHLHSRTDVSNEARSNCGVCRFPTDDANLVAITPHADNCGWAMSPDQQCKPGSYCPFACKPGMVMAQWDPESSYTYPASMNGGLFCDQNGQVHKPFPNEPYCKPGTGSVKVINKCQGQMSWCQTVLPGNEAMLIPTVVQDEAVLAVPGIDYWSSTSAHFYVNPPGSGSKDCKWGDSNSPIGNWSPFVTGANTDESGQTFVKIGWNPIFEGSSLKSSRPNWGLRVECPQGGCNGLPCEIHPAQPEGNVVSKMSAVGAGDSAFCVVTVAPGKMAHIVVFDHSGSLSDSSKSNPVADSRPKPAATSQEPVTTLGPTHAATPSWTRVSTMPTTSSAPPPAPPTTMSSASPLAVSTSATSSSTSSSTSTSTPSSASSSTPSPTPSSTSTLATSPLRNITSIKTSSAAPIATWTASPKTNCPIDPTTSLAGSEKSSPCQVQPVLKPGIFHENGTASTDSESQSSSTLLQAPTEPAAPRIPIKSGDAGRLGASTALTGIAVAFAAVACIL